MKKFTKLAALVLAVLLVLGLSACGGGSTKAAAVSGVYLTPAKLTYHNMRPQYNYYITTFAQEELTLMDDGTYCLIVSSSTFSALELAESTQDAKGNERDNSITKFYGTYTSAVNDLDEDLLDVTLSAPTRVVKSVDQNYWLDTDNWTENAAKKVIPPAGVDTETGAPIIDENAEPWTAAQYLESVAYAETSVQVNQKSASFDFTDSFVG
jgi:hypothetical protein